MSERMRESLSALMDDEADDLELARVLRALDEDDDVSGTWSRYHLASAVLRGGDATLLAGSAGFAVELDNAELEDAEVVGDAEVGGDADLASTDALAEAEPASGTRTWTSFAAAAALTLAVVLGFQLDGGSGESGEAPALASVPASGAAAGGEIRTDLRGVRRASDGAAIVQRGAGPLVLPAPAVGDVRAANPAGEEARRQVDAYMLDHAEFSLVNARAGLVPFARYATFERGQ